MKVGRNDPCPCGSGKKFKKCCLNKANAELFKYRTYANKKEGNVYPKFGKYIKEHNGRDLLNVITALQLIPENHGKNIRIEILAKEIIKSLMGGGKAVELKEFERVLLEEFPNHHLEV